MNDENVSNEDIDGMAFRINRMSEHDRDKFFQYLNGYNDGYNRCWNDVLNMTSDILTNDQYIALSSVAAESKMQSKLRINKLMEKVNTNGHAERNGDRKRATDD